MDRRKRNFLLGFAAIAIIATGLLVTWPPPFMGDNASGAIGAVRKHNQKQISSKDVILTDQDGLRDAKLLFVDYLEDATKVQKIATDLGLMAAYNREEIQAAAASLESHQNELAVRYQSSMSEALNAAEALYARGNDLGSEALAAREELGAQALEQKKGEILAMRGELNAAMSLEQMEALNVRLEAIANDLESMNLESSDLLNAAEAQLSAAAELSNRDAELNDSEVLAAAEQLNSAVETLNDESLLGASFASRVEYLGVVAMEAKYLEAAETSLNAVMAESHLQNAAELQGRLASMTEALGAAASQLEARAAENMQSHLASQEQLGAAVANLEAKLGSANLESETLAAQSLASFNKALVSARESLDAFQNDLESHNLGIMQSELSAIGAHLEAVSELQGRFAAQENLGVQSLESKKLGSQALASREENVFNAKSLESMEQVLGSAAQSLESKKLGVRLESQQLAARAEELQNRAEELQAKFND